MISQVNIEHLYCSRLTPNYYLLKMVKIAAVINSK